MAEQVQPQEKQNLSARASKSKRVLVQVNNVVKYFPVRAGLLQRVKAWVKAVDDVSFLSMKARRLVWWVNLVVVRRQSAVLFCD